MVEKKLLTEMIESIRKEGTFINNPTDTEDSPCFFCETDFEIAVDQQTKAHDQTFEGVPDSGCPTSSKQCFGVLYL